MKNNTITLTDQLYQQLCNHAKSCLPDEACGLISGNGNFVKSVFHLPNTSSSINRFYVKEQHVAKALHQISEKNEEVLAIYHTHPSSQATPSTSDLVNHPTSDIKMMILSLKQQPYPIQCYQVNHLSYTPISIVIKEGGISLCHNVES